MGNRQTVRAEMSEKSNQGMQRPSLGGIGSRFDVGCAQQTCKHGDAFRWQLAEGSKVICGICHPPAVRSFVRLAAS